MPAEQPIGFFDSGVGGLTVLRCVKDILPAENLLYLADTAHAPYGDKSIDYIRGRAHHLCELLLEREVKAVVIACNTATAAAAGWLREKLEVPIIAMEPGVKPALSLSRNGNIGVLATAETAQSAQLEALVERYAASARVHIQACPGLVEQIEADTLDSDTCLQLLQQYLEPLMMAEVDTIVLGCSHYPILKDQIQALVGEGVQLVETGTPVALELKRRLNVSGLLNLSAKPGLFEFKSSALSEYNIEIIHKITGLEASIGSFD